MNEEEKCPCDSCDYDNPIECQSECYEYFEWLEKIKETNN